MYWPNQLHSLAHAACLPVGNDDIQRILVSPPALSLWILQSIDFYHSMPVLVIIILSNKESIVLEYSSTFTFYDPQHTHKSLVTIKTLRKLTTFITNLVRTRVRTILLITCCEFLIGKWSKNPKKWSNLRALLDMEAGLTRYTTGCDITVLYW